MHLAIRIIFPHTKCIKPSVLKNYIHISSHTKANFSQKKSPCGQRDFREREMDLRPFEYNSFMQRLLIIAQNELKRCQFLYREHSVFDFLIIGNIHNTNDSFDFLSVFS